MKYEIAKQLKDAGYYKGREFQWRGNEKLKKFPNKPYQAEGQDAVYAPTLSELIEACGEEFESLERYLPNKEDTYYTIYPEALGYLWHATSLGEERDMGDFVVRCESDCCGKNGHGSTPEEAVAKLWLELNK